MWALFGVDPIERVCPGWGWETHVDSVERRAWGGFRGGTYAVEPVDGHGLEGASHHGVLLQHLVEMVDRQREEAAVGVGPDAGSAAAFRQQANFCQKRAKPSTAGIRWIPATDTWEKSPCHWRRQKSAI